MSKSPAPADSTMTGNVACTTGGTSSPLDIRVTMPPRVVCPVFMEYRNGDEVIGTVSAEFDVSGIPEELWPLAQAHLSNWMSIVDVGSVLHQIMQDKYQAPPEPPPPKNLWETLRDWFVPNKVMA